MHETISNKTAIWSTFCTQFLRVFSQEEREEDSDSGWENYSSSSSDEYSDIPDSDDAADEPADDVQGMRCPVCWDAMPIPQVATSCGHMFHSACLLNPQLGLVAGAVQTLFHNDRGQPIGPKCPACNKLAPGVQKLYI